MRTYVHSDRPATVQTSKKSQALRKRAGRTAPRGRAGRTRVAARRGCRTPGSRPLLTMATRSHSLSTSRMMCVENRMHLPMAAQLLDVLQHGSGDQHVQAGRRLVEDQHRRVVDDGPGDRHLLPHARAHLGPEHVAEVVHLQGGEHLLHAFVQGSPLQAVQPAEVLDQSPRPTCGRKWRCWRTGSRCAGGPGPAR